MASGVSIASETPDFLTPCSWNKIEQLYSGLHCVQAGAIKYKLYHITLYLPTEPFGYNYTPVRYSSSFSGISIASTWIIFWPCWRTYGLQVKCYFPTNWTVAIQWHWCVYFTQLLVISSGQNQLRLPQITAEKRLRIMTLSAKTEICIKCVFF